MRRFLAAGALAFLVLSSSGCIVTSIYPFYSDDAVAFDPALLGKWLEDDGKTTYTFVKEGEKAYRVEVKEREAGGEAETSTLVVRLFRLGDARFLDAYPTKVSDLSTGGHFLVWIELRGDTLTMRAIDVKAFDNVKAGRSLLAHVHPRSDGSVSESGSGDSDGTVLLAPTAELQAFIREHQGEMFEKEGGVMTRQR
jgi:hypothetical protein